MKPQKNLSTFTLPDLLSDQQDRPFATELQKIKTFLLHQFNLSQTPNLTLTLPSSQKQWQKTFHHLFLVRCETLKIGLILLMMCFRKGDFFQDLKEVDAEEFRGKRKEAVRLLRKILANHVESLVGNPIMDIEKVMGKLMAERQLCQDGVFPFLTENQAKQLFYKHLIQAPLSAQALLPGNQPNPNSKPKPPNYSHLTLNKASPSSSPSPTPKIHTLKPQTHPLLINETRRYCYCYIYPRGTEEGMDNCWLICVQMLRPEREGVEVFDQGMFVDEGYIGRDGEDGEDGEGDERELSFSQRIRLEMDMEKQKQEQEERQREIERQKKKEKQEQFIKMMNEGQSTNDQETSTPDPSVSRLSFVKYISYVVPASIALFSLAFSQTLTHELLQLATQLL